MGFEAHRLMMKVTPTLHSDLFDLSLVGNIVFN